MRFCFFLYVQIPSLKAVQAKTPTVSSHTYKKIHSLTAVQSFNYGLRTKTRVTLDQIQYQNKS
ncbi:exported hypothetical protein [Bacillus vallismortis]